MSITCAILASCACACSSDLRWRESPQHVVATCARTVQELSARNRFPQFFFLFQPLVHHFLHESLGAHRCSQDFHPCGVPDLEFRLRHPNGAHGSQGFQPDQGLDAGHPRKRQGFRPVWIPSLNNNGTRGSPCSRLLALTMRWCAVLIFPHVTRRIGARCLNEQRNPGKLGNREHQHQSTDGTVHMGLSCPLVSTGRGLTTVGCSGFPLADTLNLPL